MDVWLRERSLARITVGWGGVSVAAGLAVVLQGVFLLLHGCRHACGARPAA